MHARANTAAPNVRVVASMHKHVIVVDREVVERGVGVDANDRLDVVIRRVGDAVAVVRVALAHNEPTLSGSLFRNAAAAAVAAAVVTTAPAPAPVPAPSVVVVVVVVVVDVVTTLSANLPHDALSVDELLLEPRQVGG